MDSFYTLYYHILSKLPFSIRGYNDAEREIDDFFYLLSESELIKRKPYIEFISYSFAKINNLETWDTDSFSKIFFFHALNEKYSYLAINLYYYLRDSLFPKPEKKNNLRTNNVAIALSRIFIKDISFRIHYSEEKNWHITYLQQKNTLSIKIPLCRIINDGKDFKKELSDFLSKAIAKLNKGNIQLPIEKMKSSTYYKTEKKFDSDLKIYDDLVGFQKNIFKSTIELSEFKNDLIAALKFFHKNNPGFFSEENIEKNLDNWVELFFQIVLISIIYDSWVEYFPSVCGVIEKSGKKEFRNLGGIIVGYKSEPEIDIEDRAIFKIISDRISAVVSAQTIFEMDLKRRREANLILQYTILKEFHLLCLSDKVDHATKDLTKAHVNKYSSFKTMHTDSAPKVGLSTFFEYCGSLIKEKEKVDKGLFVCIHTPCPNVKKGNNIYCCNNNDSLKITIAQNDEPYVNVVLIHYLIKAFKTNKCTITVFTNSNYPDSLFICCAINNGKPISITNFIGSISGNKDNSNKAGNLGEFFIKHYEELMISCNIIIRDPNKSISTNGNATYSDEGVLLDFETDLFHINENGTEKLKCRREILKNNSHNSIIYQIRFRSI